MTTHHNAPDALRIELSDYAKEFTVIEAWTEIEEVLRRADVFSVVPLHSAPNPFFRGTVLQLDGEAHRQRRRLEAKLFTRSALRYYERVGLQPVVAGVIGRMRGAVGPGESIDLIPVLRQMLVRIAAAITGIDGVDTPESAMRLIGYADAIGRARRFHLSRDDSSQLIAEGNHALRAFTEEFFRPSWTRRAALLDERRSGEEDAGTGEDLITRLLVDPVTTWTEDVAVREAVAYLVAGIQTTTHALPHVIVHLEQWFREHPADVEARSDVGFLRRAVNESLRLHLPAPEIMRYATADATLASGRRIAAGETLTLWRALASLDDEVYGPQSDQFNPFRDRSVDATRPWGLSFGIGPHTCIGRPIVVGFEPRAGEEGTVGTMVTILRSLYAVGIELDTTRPLRKSSTSYRDVYDEFFVKFRNL
jgi:cytochrome P450